MPARKRDDGRKKRSPGRNLNVRLTPELWDDVHEAAQDDERTVSSFVRQIIKRELRRRRRPDEA